MTDISLIPKDYKKEKANFSLKFIFSKIGILAVALVILSLLTYGGLSFYSKSLNNKLNTIQDQLKNLNDQRDSKFEKEVGAIDEALKNLKIILANHLYWSNLFSGFEDIIVPKVSFSGFNGNLEQDGSVNLVLDGKTAGYTYLAKQMISFSQNKLVSHVDVSEISLGTEGGIQFGLNIKFLKDILLE